MEAKDAVFLFEKLLRESGTTQNLSDVQEVVLRQCILGQSYQQIADHYGYDHDYIKQIGAKLWRSLSQALNKKVNKGNIHSVLRHYWQEQQQLEQSKSKSLVVESPTKVIKTIQDWGDAIDVEAFVGRKSELNQCRSWIIDDRCRLLTILGMGGVGKTAIASKLAREITEEFEYVIWRSLRNAPPFKELLRDLILFVSKQQAVNLTDDIEASIGCLMGYLSSSRCLVILDNVESILRSREMGGRYREGYEGYGQLLRRLADQAHQSCLIVTSREQPIGIGNRESLVVRSQPLSGLSIAAAKTILQAKQVADSQQLIEQYQGNPLALKIAATTIKYLFGGDIGEFLNNGIIVFGDIWDLLERQFNRLSKLEQAVMYWLAINREAVTLSQLRQDIVPVISARNLLEVLESLQRRSLIEASISGFTQQPVVMEYITEKIIGIFEAEIRTGKINLLQTHPIIKAEFKDYLRETQIRLILKPIVAKLFVSLEDRHRIEQQLQSILKQLKSLREIEAQYAVGNMINLLKYLQVDLTNWDFSQLQVWQADLRGVSLQKVNFANADLSKSLFTEKMGSVFAVNFSPDGKLLATGDDQQIKIWQMPECKHIMTLPGHDAPPIWALTFSPDGQILASGSSDRTIRLWDVSTGQCLRILSGHQGSVWSLAFSPISPTSVNKGRILASGSEDGTIKLWQIETGQEIATFTSENPTLIYALEFSPDGNWLAAGNQGKGVEIWQLSTSKCVKTIPIDVCKSVPIAFSPDGQLLAIGFPQGTIKLWNTFTQKWQASLQGHDAELEDLCFSTDGATLISSNSDATIRLWQIPEGKCIKVLPGHQARITSISLANKSHILASGSEDGSIRIWDIKTGRCLRLLSGYSDRVWSIAFSPITSQNFVKGRTIASGNETGVVRLWNIQTGNYQELEQIGRVKSVAFSPDGQTLASVTYNYQIKLWNLSNLRCITTIQGANSWCWSIAFSPNSQTLATCGGDGTVRCWDVATGKLVSVLEGHQGFTLDAVFLAEEHSIATTSADKTVKLWHFYTGECRTTLEHDSVVWSITYHPASKILATGSEDGNVKLWHLDTNKCFATLTGHTQIVVSIAFSADGSLIASGGNDRTIRIWDVVTGECLTIIDAHHDAIFGVAFSPQDHIIASGSHDETIKLWDLYTGKCLQVFQAPSLYEGMNISGATGLSEAQRSTLKALGSIS